MVFVSCVTKYTIGLVRTSKISFGSAITTYNISNGISSNKLDPSNCTAFFLPLIKIRPICRRLHLSQCTSRFVLLSV